MDPEEAPNAPSGDWAGGITGVASGAIIGERSADNCGGMGSSLLLVRGAVAVGCPKGLLVDNKGTA